MTGLPERVADGQQDSVGVVTIQPAMQADFTSPYPYHIGRDGSVRRQDFWRGDPAQLIGFQTRVDVQTVDLLFADFLVDPQRAVGMFPVFARDGGSLYVLQVAISEVHARAGGSG